MKAINDINNGYKLYKELQDKIKEIEKAIEDIDNIPTAVIDVILSNEVK